MTIDHDAIALAHRIETAKAAVDAADRARRYAGSAWSTVIDHLDRLYPDIAARQGFLDAPGAAFAETVHGPLLAALGRDADNADADYRAAVNRYDDLAGVRYED